MITWPWLASFSTTSFAQKRNLCLNLTGTESIRLFLVGIIWNLYLENLSLYIKAEHIDVEVSVRLTWFAALGLVWSPLTTGACGKRLCARVNISLVKVSVYIYRRWFIVRGRTLNEKRTGLWRGYSIPRRAGMRASSIIIMVLRLEWSWRKWC